MQQQYTLDIKEQCICKTLVVHFWYNNTNKKDHITHREVNYRMWFSHLLVVLLIFIVFRLDKRPAKKAREGESEVLVQLLLRKPINNNINNKRNTLRNHLTKMICAIFSSFVASFFQIHWWQSASLRIPLIVRPLVLKTDGQSVYSGSFDKLLYFLPFFQFFFCEWILVMNESHFYFMNEILKNDHPTTIWSRNGNVCIAIVFFSFLFCRSWLWMCNPWNI